MATDGTGVTALVAAQGCPLDCRYCINQPSKTFGCEKNLTPAELYDRVKKDGLYYSATGGGVTFGGGEPLLHAGFIAAFRRIIPAEWHIYAETSLCVPEECVRAAARCVDRFFVDIKDTDPSVYRTYTGGDSLTRDYDESEYTLFGDGLADDEGVDLRQAALALEERTERVAVHVVHDEIVPSVGEIGAVALHDALVVEAAHRLDLDHELPQVLARDGEALVEDLDRDVALEVLVPCAPHDGHAAASCDAVELQEWDVGRHVARYLPHHARGLDD